MPPDTNSSAQSLHDPSSLLEHAGWVRELAQRLVRDSHAADDLTQETMLAAIENRDSETRSPRAWLGRVLRNVLWERVRQNQRRQAREQVVAKQDVTASSAELVEKVDTHRTLVDAVLRLPEHYRIVLLRRYFEGETPTQIAAALDMPISTVKTRLQRGLERMRGELDDAYGNRERWQPALIGLIGVPRRAALLPLPLLIAATLLLSGGAAVAWSVFSDPDVTPAPPATTTETATAATDDVQPTTTDLPRVPPGEDAIAVDWGAIKMPTQPVRGITVAPDGQPVGGVFLQFDPNRPATSGRGTSIVISNPDGTFEMSLSRSGRVVAIPDELATVSPGVVAIGNKQELRVVVTPAKELTGSILDEHGNALAYAQVLIGEPPAMRGLLGVAASSAAISLQEAVTDSSGTFAFTAAPLSAGSRIRIHREGFVDQEISWSGEARLDITMRQPPIGEHEARGFVLSPSGSPVADARVSCGTVVTRSDRTGAFRLPLPQLPAALKAATLVAIAPGFGAATATSTSLDEHRHPQWRNGIELQLATAPRSVHGRVLRADGSPAAGARVWIDDPTLFSHRVGGSMTTSVYSSSKSASRKFWPETVEALQSKSGQLEAVRADSDGRFTIDGLCNRTYWLMAYDFATSLRSRPVLTPLDDQDAELQLMGDVFEKVQGIVVDQHDNPIAGVNVAVWSDLVSLTWGEHRVFSKNHIRGAMRTGPDGSFWLYDVPADGTILHFDGGGILPTTHQESAEPLRIVAQRANVMTVTCSDHNAVDSVAALDKHGEPLMLTFRRGTSTFRSDRAKMLQGTAETFALTDRAVVIVGYLGDKEVRRTQLQPNMRTITW